MMRGTGLTLGKFAPLHKGHDLVFQTGLNEGPLVIIVYDAPSTTDVPLNVRAQWIRDLYPDAEVIEGHGSPEDTGYTSEIMRKQEQYVKSLLGSRKIDRFYSSESYGIHMSHALGAKNCVVDKERKTVPICSTDIRKSPWTHRPFINPRVYRDLVKNIVFVGAPSTGKTTLAKRLAEEFETVWMPEYGREYWEKNQIERRLTLEQLVEIAEGHIEREEKALYEAKSWMFTDTNAITTYLFSMYYHGKAHPRLMELATAAEKRYDKVFLCDTDIPYEDTWDRSGDANRQVFQRMFINELRTRKVDFTTLSGDLKTRLAYFGVKNDG